MSAIDDYLEHKKQMMALNDAGDEYGADCARDEMDALWTKLTYTERELLNGREP